MYALIITTGTARLAAEHRSPRAASGACCTGIPRSGSCRHEAAARRSRWRSRCRSLLLVIWGLLVRRRADTYYFPPLTDILTTFQDTWLFERVGSDVVPSLRAAVHRLRDRRACVAVALGVPLGLVAAAAARDLADRRVPARDPAAGAAAVRDRRARRRQLREGVPDRVRVPVAGAAEHDRRRHRASTRRCARPRASYGDPRRDRLLRDRAAGGRRRRSSPACAPACRWR